MKAGRIAGAGLGATLVAATLAAPQATGLATAERIAGQANAPRTSGTDAARPNAVRSAARRARKAKRIAYRGRFPTAPGSKVKLTVRTARNGKPRAVTRIDYRSIPGHCDETGGPQLLGWSFTFKRLLVNKSRRFAMGGVASDGGWARFRGRFSKNFKKVTGTFRVRSLFPAVPDAEPPVPEEYCTTIKRKFKAKR